VAVLRDSGLRAGPACTNTEARVFENYPALYRGWARKAGRPTPPESFDPRCPGSLVARVTRPGIAYPFDGARFTLDPSLARDRQRIVLAARTDDEQGRLWFVLDGKRIGPIGSPHELPWQLVPGAHELVIEAPGGASDPVHFRVD
jgi:hypothetical protein